MKVYKTGEIAKMLQCSCRTVCNWIDSGLIKGFRLPMSKDRRVNHDDLIRFLRKHEGYHPVLEQLERETPDDSWKDQVAVKI